MKKLIVDVECMNEFCETKPDHFVVELDDAMIEEIKRISTLANENNLYEVVILKNWGTYFTSEQLDNSEHLDSIDDVVESSFDDNFDINANMVAMGVHIYKDAFRFTATPKHHCDEDQCRTAKILLSELDFKEPYIAAY